MPEKAKIRVYSKARVTPINAYEYASQLHLALEKKIKILEEQVKFHEETIINLSLKLAQFLRKEDK